MADAGCQCVYVVDSAGALLPDDGADRVAGAGRRAGGRRSGRLPRPPEPVAGRGQLDRRYENGARQIDGTLCALGAGAGNSPTEILATVFELLGMPTGVDAAAVLAAAEEVVKPMITRLPVADRASIVQGRSGVYTRSCCTPSGRPTATGCPRTRSSHEVGEPGYVGGQEDMIIDVAIELAGERDAGRPSRSTPADDPSPAATPHQSVRRRGATPMTRVPTEVRLRLHRGQQGPEGPARRQGREPRRDDQARPAGAARVHHHHRGLPGLPGAAAATPAELRRPGHRRTWRRLENSDGQDARRPGTTRCWCRSGPGRSSPCPG